MKAKRWCLLLLCLILLLSLLAGCGEKEKSETKQEPPVSTEPVQTEPMPEQTAQPETEQTPAEEIPVEVEVEDPNLVKVSTAYGDLYYQEQWSEFMKTETAEEGDVLRVTFLAEFNGLGYPLFSLVIGTEEEPLAQLTDAEGTSRGVAVEVQELMEYPELSEDEQNCLYAMQEEINFVIENMK